jgi:electron transfer flavoprotein beta subunit
MKIIVAIKQVPERDAPLRIAADGRWIEDSAVGYTINEPDAYALEEALQLKEMHGGEVIALTLGPERAAAALRDALAKGADRAIHVLEENIAVLDSLGIASQLAAAVRTESPDLILTGLQSDDLGAGQTGVVLAELLGIPSATIVMQVEVTDAGLRVKRELEDGWFQHIEMPLPALLTIQSGINKLRYATLMGIKKAKTKDLKVMEAAPLNTSAAVSLERLHPPEKLKRTQMISGTAVEAATKLAEILKNEVHAI